MLLDELDERLKIVSAQGLSQVIVAQTRQKLGQGVAGWVAQSRKPLLLAGDAREDERFEDLFDVEEELKVSISVPLLLRGEVLGVLNRSSTSKALKDSLSDY